MPMSDSGGGRTIISMTGGVRLPIAQMKTGSTCKLGDLLNFDDAGGAVLADSDVGAGPLHPHAIAANDAASGGLVSYVTEAVVKIPDGGGTVGGKVYASGTPGRYTQSAPAATNATESIGRLIEKSTVSGDTYSLLHLKVDPSGSLEKVT